ncbi:MAG TPA: hypothetical protein VLH19_02070 [Patescibacteria group bacterium]|nr:hypothetical protein [Patescibacteria group bacterium]
MATVINNPPAQNNSSGLFGMIIGMIFIVVLLFLGYVYGLPALKSMQFGTPQINVPSQIDVNVKQSQ